LRQGGKMPSAGRSTGNRCGAQPGERALPQHSLLFPCRHTRQGKFFPC
jgi:hypothetical protein